MEKIVKKQELANALTHGLGAVLSIVGLIVLLIDAISKHDNKLFVSFLIYGVGISFLFTASTLYHSLHRPKIKKIMQILDHVGIYLMIAGTYTPFAMVSLQKSWGDLLLILIWAMAGAGIIFKLFFTGRFKKLSTFIYLAMGWLAIFALKPMLQYIHFNGMILILAGGLCFSIGVFFYLRDTKYIYNHAIWHLFVLAGGACHYFAVLFYTQPATTMVLVP
ncbi:PAQR family membrane homeostasis protein TrhA [Thermoflexibacter ruber]|uniref:Hemolysin III n=1 Tax=Thermoflexibacter ruber TaxID=1003 RepID=A0A1I2G1L8_9BACT|nr:hemolysin III family protein [Thermoflexibacter ruber]SFF11584.1 hemolysin III [Thermoflexibacter ruber]